MSLREYNVWVSQRPSEKEIAPQIYKCNVFSQNEIRAQSKVFGLLKHKYKIKSIGAVILKIEEVPQYQDVKARNFRIRAVYRSIKGVHYQHKEIRAPTRVKAIEKMYCELMCRHSAPAERVTIVDIEEIADSEITNKELLQIINNPKYPLFNNYVPPTAEKLVSISLNRK